ncbi:MAG: sulfatase/phosphatase domain-containing protein, partial [Pirellulaceae bacterium]
PLSSGKGSAHEGGVRVPMLVSWPGVTDPGSICEQPVMIEDFFTTILEMAKVSNVEQVGGTIDGKSFVPLLRGQHDASRGQRPLFWHFPNHWGPSGPGIGPSSAIRKGDWKLIYYHDASNYELFDLSKDLSETNNLADSHPQVREKLAAELGSYLTSVQAQMPIRKESGAAVAYPGK